jgi:hypothetical protein
MIVVVDKVIDRSFEIAGQVVVLKQDAVLEHLVPAFELALCRGIAGRTAYVIDVAIREPVDQVARTIT